MLPPLHQHIQRQHTAPHCTTLHHTAPHCNTLRPLHQRVKRQHTAPHCNTLQHTATRYHLYTNISTPIQVPNPKHTTQTYKNKTQISHPKTSISTLHLQPITFTPTHIQVPNPKHIVHTYKNKNKNAYPVAVCCSVLQSVAVSCSMLQRKISYIHTKTKTKIHTPSSHPLSKPCSPSPSHHTSTYHHTDN